MRFNVLILAALFGVIASIDARAASADRNLEQASGTTVQLPRRYWQEMTTKEFAALDAERVGGSAAWSTASRTII